AIIALFGGKLWGASWLDPVMGIVGAGLVSIWAYGLLKETGRVLLDAEMDAPVVEVVREVIADIEFDIEITDLHVWRVGKGKYACILAIATEHETSADFIRDKLSIHDELVHVTVEINRI
ncbi:MAG: cation transporter, partial [Oleibacter sp.]|nr:cation transporter [Thalassolituus sp.]